MKRAFLGFSTFALLLACGGSVTSVGSDAIQKTDGGSGSDGASSGAVCGGLAGLTCADGEYCSFPKGTCGTGDQQGVCLSRYCPPAPYAYVPVCGCDGKTYANDCAATTAGASIAHDGACATPGVCGVKGGVSCAQGEYCHFELKDQCGAADQGGQCEKVPSTGCASQYDPVCGCDGKTYGNECSAAAAGMSVAAKGACGSSGKACGGLGGATCTLSNEFCNYTLAESCGASDMQGTCTIKPTTCPNLYDPVCGCDGKTHSNECDANSLGVAVMKKGPC